MEEPYSLTACSRTFPFQNRLLQIAVVPVLRQLDAYNEAQYQTHCITSHRSSATLLTREDSFKSSQHAEKINYPVLYINKREENLNSYVQWSGLALSQKKVFIFIGTLQYKVE